MVSALGLSGFLWQAQHKFRQASEAVDAQIATYKRQRWERPTLRGAGEEGNAAAAVMAALGEFPGLSPEERDGLAAQLYYSQPLSPAQLALVDKYAGLVDKLRGSTRFAWTMTEITVERGDNAPLPPYPKVIDASLLLLAHATRGNPDDCLAIAADLMRVGQDLVPGATLEAVSIAARMTSLAVPVITHCAATASADALPRAARELNTLATHPPPTGGGIELSDLSAEVELRRLADLFPAQADVGFFTRLRRQSALLEALAHFQNPARWRELTPESYPDALDNFQRQQEWRVHSEIPLVGDASAEVQGWLYDDMRGQALLRALTVGFATLSERARQHRMPAAPIALNERSLRDPFSGVPLKWRLSRDGNELSLWSVGEDRRDDKGSNEWLSQAPLDVVVHLPLRPLDELDAQKHLVKR